jgi:hypothetical protein
MLHIKCNCGNDDPNKFSIVTELRKSTIERLGRPINDYYRIDKGIKCENCGKKYDLKA